MDKSEISKLTKDTKVIVEGYNGHWLVSKVDPKKGLIEVYRSDRALPGKNLRSKGPNRIWRIFKHDKLSIVKEGETL